jgi:hypothetical protein
MNELKTFINEMVSSVGKEDFRFYLIRWSKEEPYWCVFACEGNSFNIGGHFCIGKEENIHSVLSMLVESGWKVRIHEDFFND